ncbi:MAG: ABC transporter ATP-binding protein, partial [Tissierellia bacterium]|nr:ABC transporter ATP-binding protein [Tissierellia bacterium]
MINIENVNFSYSNSDSILKNINLQIPNGEAIALVGLSGSGKTTLTRIINGLAFRFYEGKLEGEIKIDDIDLKTKELYEIGKLIGSIFQNPKSQFFAQLVEDEIAFGPENYG